MTYPEYILKNFMMTDAEINAHYLADCRRVGIVSDTPLETLNDVTWNLADLAMVIAMRIDTRRAN